MVQLSNVTYDKIIKTRYLVVDQVLSADKFDKVVGAYMAVLYKYGVAAYPAIKSALFFDYCERIKIKVNSDNNRKFIWLDACEESVKKIVSGEKPVKSDFKYNNIQGLIGNGNK